MEAVYQDGPSYPDPTKKWPVLIGDNWYWAQEELEAEEADAGDLQVS